MLLEVAGIGPPGWSETGVIHGKTTMSDSQAPQREIWANGAAYEHYMGRWSRLVAREFLELAQRASQRPLA